MTGNVQRGSEVWELIKPFAMRDLAVLMVAGKSTGGSSEGYAIMLYAHGSKKIKQYSVTEDGLKAALAAASSGDEVILPAGTITGDQSVPDGVSLVGLDRLQCVLSGEITLGAGSLLGDVSVTRSGSSASQLNGVVLDGSGSRIAECYVSVTNTTGDAVGVFAEGGAVGYADDCIVEATGAGDGWGYYADGSQITVQGGSAYGSTAPVGSE